MVWGYILITTALGKALEVASRVAKVEGVESACAVTGAFDVVATFDVESLEDVGSIVVEGIHLIEGKSNADEPEVKLTRVPVP